jgi:tRNA G18 (ribose-2'-O)-methylase SpoU
MRKLKNNELGRLSVEEYRKTTKIPVVVVLDNIRSLHNAGSVFRTADAFLAEAIYLCGITACPPHREIQKTALGATESVKWEYFKDAAEAIRKLKKENYTVIGIEQAEDGKKLNDFVPDKNKKYALVFGHEVDGIEGQLMELLDDCIEVPQSGTKHSLNVSVCAGVVLWHFYTTLYKSERE